ncbi:hypothetical protein [Runella sp.]|uniref:hypothetical protein n=1 Tax=Runella sp. TaxID=1960881 RepID=UPI003D0B21AB
MLAQFEKFAISKNQQKAVQGGASDSDFYDLLNQVKQAEAEKQAEARRNSSQYRLNAALISGSMQIAATMASMAGAMPKR